MLPASRPRIIFEDRELRVVHRQAASDFTLITFTDLTFQGSRRDFWGREAVEKLGIDAVGFVAKRENWFPGTSVDAAVAAVRAVLKPRSLAYGYSMGAYGALKFGARLGVQASLAVSPQMSIAPGDVPWDARFHRFHHPARHPSMRVAAQDLAPFVAILADPYEGIDWRHAGFAATLGPTHLIRVPFLGHAVIWMLTGTEPLKAALDAVLASDAAALRHVLRTRRAHSGHWFRLMGRAAFRRGHHQIAEALWARGEALGMPGATISAERADALAARIELLIARGSRAEVVASCRHLESLAPCASDLVGRAAHLLLAAGATDEAESAFRRAIGLKADRADLHLGLSLALGAQGRHVEALEAARTGYAAHPGDIELATHFGHLLNAGSPAERAEAETVFRTVLAKNPGAGRALFGLSSTLAWREDKLKALAFAQRGVMRLPGDVDALAWLARLVLDTGDPVRAERLFRRVLRTAPERADGYLGLADALWATKRKVDATTVLAQAILRFPDDSSLVARQREFLTPRPRFRRLMRRLLAMFGAQRGRRAVTRLVLAACYFDNIMIECLVSFQ